MKIVITGGAGFIGSNTAYHFLKKGNHVVLFDNLSRKGTKKNIDWLKKEGLSFELIVGDISKEKDVLRIKDHVRKADAVIHLAAQVAVTTSVEQPRMDFEINALGTFNLLEIMRESKSKALCIYSSTNKVYGGMETVKVVKKAKRYTYKDFPNGISEEQLLDFHSPYGCSKGAADQYIRDYGRIYGLNTVVFRQSCIYGPRQFGVEDQGWVAWFIIATTKGEKLTIYGDGQQVRDLLFVDDLVRAYETAIEQQEKVRGGVYNIGGGKDNTMSVWTEFGPKLERLFGKKISPTFKEWRPGDQPVFISDIRKAKKEFGWSPKVKLDSGIEQLFHWVQQNKKLF